MFDHTDLSVLPHDRRFRRR